MSKTPNLQLEITDDGSTTFSSWRQSLNGNGSGSSQSNVQKIDTWAGTVNTSLTDLSTRINNIKERGRFLSIWNPATGLPTTDPTSLPYTYHTGDYFIVGTVTTGTHYKPSGTTYTGTASAAVETETLKAGNEYWFDGSVWALRPGTVSLPDPPSTAGTYSLYCTVASDGTVTYFWQ